MPLRPRVSPIAHRTIRQAFDDLERTISEKDKIGFASTTLENVVQAAHAIEDELAARQLLRNMRRLAPLFNGLGYYSKSIEVVCNGTPYLPWIWAPIKLVLKVASDYIEAFEKLIVAYARIAEPLARFNLLHQTHFDNLEIQQALAMFYSDILRFHKEAYKFVRRGGWKVLFMTSWGRFQRRFDSIIDNLKAHEGLVDKTVNAVGSCDIRKTREEVEALRMERLERVAKEDEDRTAAQYIAIVGWLKMDDAEQAKILDTVLVEPRQFSETCDWMLRQDRIAAWMRCSQESPFFVLHGRPGTGKSVLMAQITEFLRSAGKSLVISHISTYTQPSSTEYDQILRSILLQLVRSDTDLIAYIHDEFILRKKAVTAQAVERIILEAVRAISNNPATTRYVHILLDGLDECHRGKQLKIVTLLERIASCAFESPTTVCKVLISCRMLPPTSQRLSQKHAVSLSTEKVAVERSIGFYASQRLSKLRSRWSQLGITDSELKQLELRLAVKADGMFLWAKLVLNYLATNMFLNKSEVLEAVDVLPRELSDFYGRILTQLLANFDNRSVTRLQSILGWIAFAKRPLRRAELRSALAFACDKSEVHVQGLAPNYIFDLCTPLIEERPDSTFAFVHMSVKEFLQSPEANHILDETRAVHDQGFATASCLLSGYQVFQPDYPEDVRFSRVLRGFHGLHLYASEYWVEYILSVAVSDRGIDTGSTFFSRSRELASALNSIVALNDRYIDPNLLDSRLSAIGQHPEVWNTVVTTLAERTAKSLPAPQENEETVLAEITNLATLHSNYQRTVKAVLQLTQFPGISSRDLEIFKREVRSTALTCRIISCPLAGIYFENEAQRDKHELNHAPQIMCDVSGCGYPPLSSVAALRNHKIKQHNSGRFPQVSIPKHRLVCPRKIPPQATRVPVLDLEAHSTARIQIISNCMAL
ncbi:putative NACHT domain containing protein [Rhypophila sp. PSN 637]